MAAVTHFEIFAEEPACRRVSSSVRTPLGSFLWAARDVAEWCRRASRSPPRSEVARRTGLLQGREAQFACRYHQRRNEQATKSHKKLRRRCVI
jgi:hypothetical protein